MALGAHRGDTPRLFVRQGMTTVALSSLKDFVSRRIFAADVR
jgi:hypothetical protein